MLRYVVRRMLWAVPTLFGISLIVFFVTSLIPEPGGDSAAARIEVLGRDPGAFAALEEQRRQRFLDLPRFFNPRPSDVRSLAAAAVDHLAAGDGQAPLAAHQLAQLGGAALPWVLPKLDNLQPAARGRVAVALAPVARRMGVGDDKTLDDPRLSPIFWSHFWEDHALEFTEPALRRAVSRLVRHATEMREKDLVTVDTFALPEIIRTMPVASDRAALARLAELAAHCTGRAVFIPVDADADFVRRALADWQEWWYVHKNDYIALDGAGRVSATLAETRYGKWIARAATGQLGVSVRDGEPIVDKLRARAPVTLALTLLAMFASYLIAIPVAAISAWRRGRAIDHVLGFVLFALYSLPTFWLAELFAGFVPHAAAGRLTLAALALTVASVATLSRYQRSAMLEVLGLDYIRTARAKGVSTLGVIVKHALRNAMMPTVTLAGLQLPTLIGGAFLVEEVFGLPGLGYESLRAVEAHDASWLIAVILLTAVIATIGLIASDVAYGLLDPRIRERQGSASSGVRG